MRWSPFSLLGLLAAASNTYTPNPDRDLQIYFLFDARIQCCDLGYYLAVGTQKAAYDMNDLVKAYNEKGYTIQAEIATYGSRTGTCWKQLVSPWSSDWSGTISSAMWSWNVYDVKSSTDEPGSNIYNAIMHVAACDVFRKDESVRRLIVVFTDMFDDFSSTKSDWDPWKTPSCPQDQPSAAQFKEVIESARVGLLIGTVGRTQSSAESQQAKINGFFAKTGLTDYASDTSWNNESWDTVKWHVSRMSSAEYLATTSTTTVAPPESYQCPIGHDARVQFLIDASASQDLGYHSGYVVSWFIDTLRSAETDWSSLGHKIEVGAAAFGRTDGTCYKPIMDFTTSADTISQKMHDPPRFDADKSGDRNTLNAIMYAARSLFDPTANVRRVVVVITDDVGQFGSGNHHDRTVEPQCPQTQPSIPQFVNVVRQGRIGLFIVTQSGTETAAKKQQEVIEAQFEPTGLDDIRIHPVWSKKSYLAVEKDFRLYLSDQWAAYTTTPKPRAYREIVEDCLQQEQCAV